MRSVLVLVVVATVFLMAAAVLIFHFSLQLSWSDAVYFAIATITTVGYGDIHLRDSPLSVKLFGCLLMLSGAASLAAIFGMITDMLLQAHFLDFLGGGRRRMRNHIVLCGLGKVGIRVLKHLRKLGEQVVVVEKREECEFLEEARSLNVPVVVGDIRMASTLHRASIEHAKALVAVSDEDLANLEAALNARAVRSDIRTVLRIFDQNLADKVRSGFGFEVAISTSAISAPAFAMAAVDPSVIGSFFVGDKLMLNIELPVREGTRLAGMTTRQLDQKGNIAVLSHTSGTDGEQRFHPTDAIPLRPGDTLVVCTLSDYLPALHEMNTPNGSNQPPALSGMSSED